MPFTLSQQYANAQNVTTFLNRITMSLCATAQAVSAEASAADHANRVALAKAVANSPVAYTQTFAFMIAAQNISDADTDATINTNVSAVWNALAGVP